MREILIDFRCSFIAGLRTKFSTKRSLRTPPHSGDINYPEKPSREVIGTSERSCPDSVTITTQSGENDAKTLSRINLSGHT